MCTVLYRPWQRGRFVAAIGLNRDEAYARPSSPPLWWPPEAGGAGFLAPRDLTAGGTWFGLGEGGLFAALTNGRQPDEAFRHERSRGELVAMALRRGRLDEAVAALEGLEAHAFAPCHLLLAQGGRLAYVAPGTGGRFSAQLLPPAAYAVRNDGLSALGGSRQARAGAHQGGVAALHAIRAALVEHGGAAPACHHDPTQGTCSSAVVLVGQTLAESRLFFAAGRPCETPFHEYTQEVSSMVDARVEHLARQLEKANAEALAAVEDCPDGRWEAPCEGRWSVAVTAHHIADGQLVAREILQGLLDGSGMPAYLHGMTAEAAEELGLRRAGCTKQQVTEALRRTGAEMAAVIRGWSAAQLDAPLPLPGRETPPSLEALTMGILIRHIEGHTASIRAASAR